MPFALFMASFYKYKLFKDDTLFEIRSFMHACTALGHKLCGVTQLQDAHTCIHLHQHNTSNSQ